MKKNKTVKDNAFTINDEIFSGEVFINDDSENIDQDIEKPVIEDRNKVENKGQTILFAAACLMLLGVGVPVILIYYLNAPLPDQHLFILGVSYSKLVLISFICSALMVYLSFFFMRTRPVVIIPVFLFALFCCFPFILGLKNKLTPMETLLDQRFFSNWPFFLKPAYLFFELFIPMGICIYLFLQLKNIFKKKQLSFAYLCIAAYLGISVFIGMSILHRTGQPDLISFIIPRIKTVALSSTAYIKNTLPGPDLSTSTSVPAQKDNTAPVIEKQPEIYTDPAPHESIKGTTALEQNIENMRIQSDHILDILSKIDLSLSNKNDGMEKTRVNLDEPALNELKAILNKTSTFINTSQETHIDMQKELQDLSNRLDLILKSISPDISDPIKNELAKEKTIETTKVSRRKSR